MTLKKATLPAWSACTADPTGALLTSAMMREMFDAIMDRVDYGHPQFITPPPVHGTNQAARRRRTIFMNGVRVTMPEGARPVAFLLSNGQEGWPR